MEQTDSLNPIDFDIAGRRNVYHTNRRWSARECSREVGVMKEMYDNRTKCIRYILNKVKCL